MYSWCDFEMAGTTIGPSDAAADDWESMETELSLSDEMFMALGTASQLSKSLVDLDWEHPILDLCCGVVSLFDLCSAIMLVCENKGNKKCMQKEKKQ
jgi:hypothetical protein